MYPQHDDCDDDYDDDALTYVCHLLFIPVTITAMLLLQRCSDVDRYLGFGQMKPEGLDSMGLEPVGCGKGHEETGEFLSRKYI